MAYRDLTQEPLAVGLKNATPEARLLVKMFVDGLNELMQKSGYDKIWYQPDDSTAWLMRWYWMYHYKSEKRDFITRLNFESRHSFQINFSHFGARIPAEVEFLPEALMKDLKYKGFPAHVLIKDAKDCQKYMPLIAEHYIRIRRHLEAGGTLPLRGCSHIEIALGSYLSMNDKATWTRWEKPVFLGRREVDLCSLKEKIAIEIQGDYWHRRKEIKEKDTNKKEDLLANGWSVVWAWEGGIKEKFHLVLDALDQVRNGQRFVEIKKK
ncbi:MAG: hypothetical protein CVT49_07785 [candidate division Zixibacteria bacterium HGW-Zixibacteria-1]|nr:MAG: hypothetical protein CVT49_07785 [candidate division Zixibacteria bacterium HGW-Zixibacteria-1]